MGYVKEFRCLLEVEYLRFLECHGYDEEGIQLCEEILSQDSNNLECLFLYAIFLRKLQKPKEAIKILNEIIQTLNEDVFHKKHFM